MQDTPTILRKIVGRKHEEVSERQIQRPLASLQAEAAALPACRGFVQAISGKLSSGLQASSQKSESLAQQGASFGDISAPSKLPSPMHQLSGLPSILTDVDFFKDRMPI